MNSSLWTDGEHDARTDLQTMWRKYLYEYDVNLILAGHNHSYERSKPLEQFESEKEIYGDQLGHLHELEWVLRKTIHSFQPPKVNSFIESAVLNLP